MELCRKQPDSPLAPEACRTRGSSPAQDFPLIRHLSRSVDGEAQTAPQKVRNSEQLPGARAEAGAEL